MIKKLSNIKIKDSFIEHPPREEKMNYKISYYLITGKFEQPIVINKEGYLIDGYTTYLICKCKNKKYVRVVRG
nr:MAG TPA: hypothetical protein [Caudoviricetes sp.]